MTPKKDAWLGLGATEALTAMADDGLVAKARPRGCSRASHAQRAISLAARPC